MKAEMKQNRIFVCLFIITYRCLAQETTSSAPWNGDPKICTPNVLPPGPTDPPIPQFPKIAEFSLEQVETAHILDQTMPSQLTLYQYLYDYEANKLIRVRNTNGMIDLEYFYYEIGKKSVYHGGAICEVLDILPNVEIDGTSSIILPDGTTHIRPLEEFLLFSRNDPRKPLIRPRFINQTIIRGVSVNLWETCIIDTDKLMTQQRLWALASSFVIMPTGKVENTAVPVQATIRSSIVFANQTEYYEVDEVFSVHTFRPGIIETSDQLSPPKGTFCQNGNDQNLVSLRDLKMVWPDRFSVRIEASTSRSSRWERFHLRYNNGQERGGRIVRYDFLPPGSEDYRSIIHDYAENLTYTVDIRTGACQIARLERLKDVTPFRDPIDFFIKHERRFLFDSDSKRWELNGARQCRGDSIRCLTTTTSFKNFPPFVEPDTGEPDGSSWDFTNLEYAWTFRSPNARPADPNVGKSFDYPVYLYLKLFHDFDPTNPSIATVDIQDLEYEFYEMSTESNPYDFDTSSCYRTNRLEYLHLGFTMTSSVDNAIDVSTLDRRLFERQLHALLSARMTVKYSRISGIVFEHEQISNEILVFFTLLGKTPNPGSTSGVIDSEISVNDAVDRLKLVIDNGNFRFTMPLNDRFGTDAEFRGKQDSLKNSTTIMSTHASGTKIVETTYSSSSEALAVIVGTLIGLLIGAILAAVIRILRKEQMPDILHLPKSFSNPIPSISFHKKAPAEPAPSTSIA